MKGHGAGGNTEGRWLLVAALAGRTATSIARACHVTPAAISALATGKRQRPTLDLGLALMDRFGIDIRAWRRAPSRGQIERGTSISTRVEVADVTLNETDANETTEQRSRVMPNEDMPAEPARGPSLPLRQDDASPQKDLERGGGVWQPPGQPAGERGAPPNPSGPIGPPPRGPEPKDRRDTKRMSDAPFYQR